jgi:hypothetical protein
MLATDAQAEPTSKSWDTLRLEKQFDKLKSGDKIAFVCNTCQTISAITIKSHDYAMELCEEGTAVSCPECKMNTRVTLKRQRNDPPIVTYVNDKGEERSFIVAMPGTK